MGNDSSHSNIAPSARSEISTVSISTLSTIFKSQHDNTGNTPNTIEFKSMSSNEQTLQYTALHPPQNYIRSSNLPNASFTNLQFTPIEPSSPPNTNSPFQQLTDFPSVTPVPVSSSSVSTKKKPYRRRLSTILFAQNGITGKYISGRICKIAAIFWKQNIETLSISEQLEIGCSLFFGMMSTNNEMKQVMKVNFNHDHKIENASLRYLDMMGWLIRYLSTDNINLHSLLTQLGALHQQMGIKIQHFDPMLQAMHESFAYYFESKYSIEVKYAMDEIFSMAAQIMTGKELTFGSHLMDITREFQGKDIAFLESLRICLKSDIGKEYLYRYLVQTWCDEIAIFLQSLSRFKSRTTDKERFFVARDIMNTSIKQTATFAVNVSYETRTNVMKHMAALEKNFSAKKSFEITAVFFTEVEREVYKLIQQNHWRKFVEEIERLHSKSFNV